MKQVKGVMRLVKNKERKANENEVYVTLRVEFDSKMKERYGIDEKEFVFTLNELKRPSRRALKNPEDLEVKIFDVIGDLL